MKPLIKSLMIGLMLIKPMEVTISQSTKMSERQSRYNYVYGFGDDLFDTGAFVQYAGKYVGQSDSENYDNLGNWERAKFLEPMYRGRSISTRRVALEVITTNFLAFGAEPIVDHKENQWLQGTNWSTIGARIGETDPRFYGPEINNIFMRNFADKYTFSKQVAGYKKAILNRGRKITNKDLVVINIGTNDILDIIEAGWQPDWNIKRMMFVKINQIVNTLIEQVKIIMAEWPKDIVIWNMPNLSRIPRYVVANNLKRDAASEYSSKFNELLKNALDYLRRNGAPRQKTPRLFDFKMNFANYLNISLREKKDYNKAAIKIDFNTSLFKGVFHPVYINGANAENLDKYAFLTDIHLGADFHDFLANQFSSFLESS